MQAVILGATGLIGSEILKRIVDDPFYEKIYVVGRSEPKIKHAKIVFEKCELAHLSASVGLRRAEHLYCALGSTIKKAGSQDNFRRIDLEAPLLAAKLALDSPSRLQKFLLVSALGADEKSKVFYNQVKGELEKTLCSIGIPELQIFRPSLLLGDRSESRPGEYFAQKATKALGFLFSGPLKKYKPIDARVVAHAMIRKAESVRDPGQHIYESDSIEQLVN